MPAPTYTHRRSGERRTPVQGGAEHARLDAHPDWVDGAEPGPPPVDDRVVDDPARPEGADPEESS